MKFRHTDAVEARAAMGKGLGVFARRAICAGEEIERVPVLILPMSDLRGQDEAGGLVDYCFYWGRNRIAVALGFGSLYNHSYEPNARYDDQGRRTKVFTAIRDIKPGEEITVNYNGDPEDRDKVAFPVREKGSTGGQKR